MCVKRGGACAEGAYSLVRVVDQFLIYFVSQQHHPVFCTPGHQPLHLFTVQALTCGVARVDEYQRPAAAAVTAASMCWQHASATSVLCHGVHVLVRECSEQTVKTGAPGNLTPMLESLQHYRPHLLNLCCRKDVIFDIISPLPCGLCNGV